MKRSLLVSVLVLAPSVVMADDTTDLVKLLDGVKSLDTTFEQVLMDRNGSRAETTKGHMWVERPLQFRWHADEPYEQLVVSDGDKVWVHDIDLEQVIERPLGNEVGETPALLLSGDSSSIAEEFSVEKLESRGKKAIFKLTPKSNEPLFDVLEVTFKGDTPEAMRIEDTLGQKTNFEFIKPKLNARIDKDKFVFDIPEGVDVVRNE